MYIVADNEPSAIWESQQVCSPTHMLTVLEIIWRVLQTAMQHTGEGMCFGQICCLWSTHLASKRRNWLPCSTCQAMASLKYLHVCIVCSSDIRQALTLFCPSVFHTHSHGKLSAQWCVNIFVQGIEISVELRSLGEMGYHSITLWYSVSNLRRQCHVHRYVHSYKNTQLETCTELCAGVWGDNHYAASVSLRYTELAEVNVCTSA